MAAQTSGPSSGGIHSINITPMVDIILVLLVIFMVTSSAINASEAVEIDKPDAASGNATKDASQTLVITCDPDGRFYAGEDLLEGGAAIEAYAREVVRTESTTQAIVRCDRSASVGDLVVVIDALREAGLKKYAISTDPKPKGPASAG